MLSRIVIFEGGDVSGKTTQANMYYDYLLNKYHKDPKNEYQPVYMRFPKNKNSPEMEVTYENMNKFVLGEERKTVTDHMKCGVMINNMIKHGQDKFEFFELLHRIRNREDTNTIYIIDRCLISGTIYNFHAIKLFYEKINEVFPLDSPFCKNITNSVPDYDLDKVMVYNQYDANILCTARIGNHRIDYKDLNILNVVFKPSHKLYEKTIGKKNIDRENDEYDTNKIFQECVNHFYDILTSGDEDGIKKILGENPPIIPVITDDFDLDSTSSVEDISKFIIEKCDEYFK